jgi:hypothetical protein
MAIINSAKFKNYYSQNSAADNLPSEETSSLESSKSDWIKNKIFIDNKKIYYQSIIVDDKNS